MSELNKTFRKVKVKKKVEKIMAEKQDKLKHNELESDYEGYERAGTEKSTDNKIIQDFKYKIRNILKNPKLSQMEKNYEIYGVVK